MATRRPLTTTAVAAGIGTVVALTLGPMAAAATTTAARHDLRPASAAAAATPARATAASSSGLTLADTGVDTVPYAVSGFGSLVLGVGLVYAARRFAAN